MGIQRILRLPGCSRAWFLCVPPEYTPKLINASLRPYRKSCVNLLFGPTFSSPDGSSGGQARSQPADLASALLVRLATALGWSIDVHTWSKAIGLVLTGSIILVNINAVLGYVSRVSAQIGCSGVVKVELTFELEWQTFRATSAGVSASFMLLFLSQLMVRHAD